VKGAFTASEVVMRSDMATAADRLHHARVLRRLGRLHAAVRHAVAVECVWLCLCVVCVCVCERVRVGCACVCLFMYLCICVYVCDTPAQ
jgi:hypothetical protein